MTVRLLFKREMVTVVSVVVIHVALPTLYSYPEIVTPELDRGGTHDTRSPRLIATAASA